MHPVVEIELPEGLIGCSRRHRRKVGTVRMSTKERRDQILVGIVYAISSVVLSVLCVFRLWSDSWYLYFVDVALGVGALACFGTARRYFPRGAAKTRNHHSEAD